MPKTIGQALAAELPARDDDWKSSLIALCDLVSSGIEVPWTHFKVDHYNYEASGAVGDAWAKLTPLQAAQPDPDDITKTPHTPVWLTEEIVRHAVAKYVDNRIDGGMGLEEARRLIDGSYTDAEIADSILQFALYGEEVFS